MIRKIIKIAEEKCNGCGLCVSACHEGAIGLQNDKAVLLRDDYCDGLGDCLPVCPTGAISFETREALAYDEAAVFANMAAKEPEAFPAVCPGSAARSLEQPQPTLFCPVSAVRALEKDSDFSAKNREDQSCMSHLRQWPVQIKLAPVNAPYLNQAHLLVAADCCAYAYGDFHREFMAGKVTLIGCPKLDAGDYSEKLCAILQANSILSLTVTRMEVPCCGGLEQAVRRALQACGKDIVANVVTIGIDGRLVRTEAMGKERLAFL